MKKIVCFHLFNDFSGSPKILSMVLSGIIDKRFCTIDVITSKSNGALSILSGKANFKTYKYSFSHNIFSTFISYIRVQILTFFIALKYLFDKDTIFYINTLLPAGPALAGKLIGKKVVYHYHENANVKGLFYKLLSFWMQLLADKIICVSEYQKSFLRKQNKCIVVPNALPENFSDYFKNRSNDSFDNKTVLLLSSLKEYKGTIEFFKLASMLPQYRFFVVVNDIKENINKFIRDHHLEIYPNLKIFDRQNDVRPFYRQASIVLNLTNKNMAIETFGLTALEAMTAGLPVIVPTVGGIAEMVEDGVNGYKIDIQDLDKIKDKIIDILINKNLYRNLSNNARSFSDNYSEKNMINRILYILN